MRSAFGQVADAARAALLKQLERKTVAEVLQSALEHPPG
jgi:hypothetical protein